MVGTVLIQEVHELLIQCGMICLIRDANFSCAMLCLISFFLLMLRMQYANRLNGS